MATVLLKDDASSRVPIFISAQELARMMRSVRTGWLAKMMRGMKARSARTGDFFHMYIDTLQNLEKGVKEMLLDAYTKRNAILILDGLVSCSRFGFCSHRL